MARFRRRAREDHEPEGWVGPFGPPPPSKPAVFNSTVKTAAELVVPHGANGAGGVGGTAVESTEPTAAAAAAA